MVDRRSRASCAVREILRSTDGFLANCFGFSHSRFGFGPPKPNLSFFILFTQNKNLQMGKKKSKISKQKQAKAKQKQGKKTSMGGVAVSKGFSSKFQQANKSSSSNLTIYRTNTTANNNNSNNGKNITEASLRQKLQRKTRKVFLSPTNKIIHRDNNKNNDKRITNDDEQEEFKRQMASLQERQLAKTTLKKQTKMTKTIMKTDATSFFKPASFSLQKSPHQLLQETTRHMESLSGVGEQGVGSYSATPKVSNQSWVVSSEPITPLLQNNPFGALKDDDSDDEGNEWAAPKLPFVSLAPATFSLLPRTTPTPATSPFPHRDDDDENDPDL